MSRLRPPSATSRAICSSCGVSWSSVLASRLRAVSPVARSSRGRAVGPRRGAERLEALERRPQLRPRLGLAPGAPQELAVRQLGARLHERPGHASRARRGTPGSARPPPPATPAARVRVRATMSPTACAGMAAPTAARPRRRRARRRAARARRQPRRGCRSRRTGRRRARRRRRPAAASGRRPAGPCARSSSASASSAADAGCASPRAAASVRASAACSRHASSRPRTASTLREQGERDRCEAGLARLARQRQRLGGGRFAGREPRRAQLPGGPAHQDRGQRCDRAAGARQLLGTGGEPRARDEIAGERRRPAGVQERQRVARPLGQRRRPRRARGTSRRSRRRRTR